MFLSQVAATALVLALPLSAFAEPLDPARHELAKRAPADIDVQEFTNARWSYFVDGL